MRALLTALLLLAGCGNPPPIERPPPPGDPVRARVVLTEDEGVLHLRRLRFVYPGSVLNPKKRYVDGFSLRLDRDTVRRIALADVTHLEVEGRVLNRLKVKVVAKQEPLAGTVESDLELHGVGELGFDVSVRLEDTHTITVRRR